MAEVLVGDVLDVLRTLPNDRFQCVVTSPPYWGLRDYGIPGQIGAEPTPEEYVAKLVAVFREVRRTLRDDGVLWLNLGDTYAANRSYQVDSTKGGPKHSPAQGFKDSAMRVPAGLKEKDLVGIPWQVALALRADGWFLRSDVIWAKGTSHQKAMRETVQDLLIEHGVDTLTASSILEDLEPYVGNCMPSSVQDRPTTSHEYVFLLSKSKRYFYDADAVREGFADARNGASGAINAAGRFDSVGRTFNRSGLDGSTLGHSPKSGGRNMRSVWTIPTTPFPGAHFATFPERLVAPMLQAGTSGGGACGTCGAPRRRVVERGAADEAQRSACGADSTGGYSGESTKDHAAHGVQDASAVKARVLAGMVERRTVGWEPGCGCEAPSIPCRVLDPFGGSGTVGVVAGRLGMDATLIELNPAYADMARQRLADPDGFAKRVRREARERKLARERSDS